MTQELSNGAAFNIIFPLTMPTYQLLFEEQISADTSYLEEPKLHQGLPG